MSEQRVVNLFLASLAKQIKQRGSEFHYWQIESGATAIGIPDVYMLIDHVPLWVEFKMLHPVVKTAGNPTFKHVADGANKVQFRPGQLATQYILNSHGQYAISVVLTMTQDFVVLPPEVSPTLGSSVRNINWRSLMPLPHAYWGICSAVSKMGAEISNKDLLKKDNLTI